MTDIKWTRAQPRLGICKPGDGAVLALAYTGKGPYRFVRIEGEFLRHGVAI